MGCAGIGGSREPSGRHVGMSIRWKLLLLLAGGFALFIALSVVIEQHAFAPSLEKLEKEQATRDLQRCTDAMQRELQSLSIFNRTWSAWDGAYGFMQHPTEEWKKTNLPSEV